MQENDFKVFQINECRRIIVSKEFYEQKKSSFKNVSKVHLHEDSSKKLNC